MKCPRKGCEQEAHYVVINPNLGVDDCMNYDLFFCAKHSKQVYYRSIKEYPQGIVAVLRVTISQVWNGEYSIGKQLARQTVD